jgi:branched-chain amino acid transport system substrate-binding protein
VRFHRWAAGVSGLAAVALLSTACSAADAAKDDGSYTIGVIVSQTGSGSQLGVGELQGAQLAVDRLNSRAGINGHPVRLVTADDQSNPAQAVLAARRMIGKVDAIVGPSLSGPCRAVIPLAASAQLVDYCLSPGVKPAADGWQWSASASTEDLAERLLEYWKSRGITRIGLISTTDASGVDGALSTKHAAGVVGVQVVSAASYGADAVSVTSQLQAVSSAQPQALVVWSTGAAAAVAFKGAREMGLHLPTATTDGNLTYNFLRRVKDYLPETLLIPATQDFWWEHSPRGPEARQLEQDYHDQFQARYGTQPDFGPGVAFDAVTLTARALGEAQGDPHRAKQVLQNLRGVIGVVGTYSFGPQDHRGLTKDDIAIVRASRDSFTYVGR